MRTFVCNIISVAFTSIKFTVLKLFHWKGFKTGLIERFSPDTVVQIGKGARLELGKRVSVHSGAKLMARTNARLTVGSNVMLNYGCIVVCRESISDRKSVV